jgi:hypothetical protein
MVGILFGMASVLQTIQLAHAIDCSSSPYLISTQQDITNINDCAAQNSSITGNITIAPSATGDMWQLRENWSIWSYKRRGAESKLNTGEEHSEYINTSVIAENNPTLTSLHLNTGRELRDFALRNLTIFETISAPNMNADNIDFEHLPSLSSIAMRWHEVSSLGLPSLSNLGDLSLAPSFLAVHGDVEIQNVGFESLDSIVGYGRFNTNATHPNPNYLLSGIPKRAKVQI